jgi:hypothetical protein
VPKDEGSKSLSAVDLRYISGVRTIVTSERRTCATCGDPCQQGHMVQSDNDKCQVESTFQVCANHESE